MSYGDAFVIFKWIDDWKQKAGERRIKKLNQLKEELRDNDEKISLLRIQKSDNFLLIQRLIARSGMLNNKIKSMADR